MRHLQRHWWRWLILFSWLIFFGFQAGEAAQRFFTRERPRDLGGIIQHHATHHYRYRLDYGGSPVGHIIQRFDYEDGGYPVELVVHLDGLDRLLRQWGPLLTFLKMKLAGHGLDLDRGIHLRLQVTYDNRLLPVTLAGDGDIGGLQVGGQGRFTPDGLLGDWQVDGGKDRPFTLPQFSRFQPQTLGFSVALPPDLVAGERFAMAAVKPDLRPPYFIQTRSLYEVGEAAPFTTAHDERTLLPITVLDGDRSVGRLHCDTDGVVYHASDPQGLLQLWLVRIDQAGNVLWPKQSDSILPQADESQRP